MPETQTQNSGPIPGATPALQKDLRIKQGSVRRMTQELTAYVKEEATQRAIVDKMKAEEKCPHDIKQAEEVLNETRIILPDSRLRLLTYIEGLEEFFEEHEVFNKIGSEADCKDPFVAQVFDARVHLAEGRKALAEQ